MLEIYDGKKNPADIGEVIPGLAVDLEKCLANGVAVGGMQNATYENTLKSPSEVGSYVRDNLDALQIAKEMKSSMAAVRKTTTEKTSTEGKVAPSGE